MSTSRTSPPRTRLARFAAILLATAGSLLAAGVAPAIAASSAATVHDNVVHSNTVRPNVSYNVTLTSNTTQLWPTRPVTFTATVSPSLFGSGKNLFIYNESTSTLVAECAKDTCIKSTTQPFAGNDFYIAYVSDPADTTFSRDVAISNQVVVTYTGIGLSMHAAFNANTQFTGGTTTLVATSSRDITGAPFVIQIWDLTTGGSLGFCNTGTSCVASVSEDTATTHAFAATFASENAAYPPLNQQTTSGNSYVTWTGGTMYSISLAQGNSLSNGEATVVAGTNVDVASINADIEIFDANSGQMLTICPSGRSCTAQFIPDFLPGSHLVAFITTAALDTNLPPASAIASSNTVTVSQL